MQDRYTGDIGDFVKYGLLRAIRGRKRLGVAWYLHPDGGREGNGQTHRVPPAANAMATPRP